MKKFLIAADNGGYRLEWIDTTLKVRRIGEVTNQVCGTHPHSRIRASLAFIYLAISVNIRTSCSVNLPAANR